MYGKPPLEALQLALQQATIDELGLLSKALSEVPSVQQLTVLSYRQKEALIALRYARVASLSHLCRVLNWDRSHTFHRLAALVQKGYALKFYGEAGPQYFAIYDPLETSIKSQAYQIMRDFFAFLRPGAKPATLATSATRATFATPATPGDRRLYTLADMLSATQPIPTQASPPS